MFNIQSLVNLTSLTGFCCFSLVFFFTRMAMHGSCLSWTFVLTVSTHWLLCQSPVFTVTSISWFFFFWWKETRHEPKVNLNECVFSWRNEPEHFEIHLLAVCWFRLFLKTKTKQEAWLHLMSSKVGNFIFLLKMYYLDVLCKSKVVLLTLQYVCFV